MHVVGLFPPLPHPVAPSGTLPPLRSANTTTAPAAAVLQRVPVVVEACLDVAYAVVASINNMGLIQPSPDAEELDENENGTFNDSVRNIMDDAGRSAALVSAATDAALKRVSDASEWDLAEREVQRNEEKERQAGGGGAPTSDEGRHADSPPLSRPPRGKGKGGGGVSGGGVVLQDVHGAPDTGFGSHALFGDGGGDGGGGGGDDVVGGPQSQSAFDHYDNYNGGSSSSSSSSHFDDTREEIDDAGEDYGQRGSDQGHSSSDEVTEVVAVPVEGGGNGGGGGPPPLTPGAVNAAFQHTLALLTAGYGWQSLQSSFTGGDTMDTTALTPSEGRGAKALLDAVREIGASGGAGGDDPSTSTILSLDDGSFTVTASARAILGSVWLAQVARERAAEQAAAAALHSHSNSGGGGSYGGKGPMAGGTFFSSSHNGSWGAGMGGGALSGLGGGRGRRGHRQGQGLGGVGEVGGGGEEGCWCGRGREMWECDLVRNGRPRG